MVSIVTRLFLALPETAPAVQCFENHTEGVTPPLPNFEKLLKWLKDVLFAAGPKRQQCYK